MHVSHWLRVCLIVFALSGLSIASAQSDSLPAPQEVEYDLGYDCPVSSALDSTAAVLWVLMNNCGNNHYYVQGFDVANGAPINSKISNYKDELSILTYEDYFPMS